MPFLKQAEAARRRAARAKKRADWRKREEAKQEESNKQGQGAQEKRNDEKEERGQRVEEKRGEEVEQRTAEQIEPIACENGGEESGQRHKKRKKEDSGRKAKRGLQMGKEPKKKRRTEVSIDDDAKKGFIFINLTVDEMAVSSRLFTGTKVENAEIRQEIKQDEVTVEVNVSNKDDSNVQYHYHKKLPQNIDPVFSKLRILKDKKKSHVMPKFHKGRIRLELKKDPDNSWTQHSKYLICPE